MQGLMGKRRLLSASLLGIVLMLALLLMVNPSTATAALETPANTPFPPTNTPTNTATNTPFPPTNTPTNTPTSTPVPPTYTPTNTPTSTPVPPTLTPTYTPTPTPVAFEGCSPGYWKNHLKAWGTTGYAPFQTLESVFDLPDSLGQDNDTLLKALKYQGGPGVSGGARIMLRAAVAALLNASDPTVDYPRTTAEVIADVNTALASGNRSALLVLAAELDADNNLGCPLNGSVRDNGSAIAAQLQADNIVFLPLVDSD